MTERRKIENRIVARMQLPPGPMEAGTIWTPKLVDKRIEDAALTIPALPTGIRRSITLKIDVVHKASEAYGYSITSSRVMPGSEAIRDAFEVMEWLRWLSPRDQTLVWSRALGVKWRKLEARLGYSERQLSTFRRNAVLQIVARLNGAVLRPAT